MNETSDSKFITGKWNIVNDQSNENYDVGNGNMYSTKLLKSNLCDYIYAYILVSDNITTVGDDGAEVALSNCETFVKCITKINGTTMEDG